MDDNGPIHQDFSFGYTDFKRYLRLAYRPHDIWASAFVLPHAVLLFFGFMVSGFLLTLGVLRGQLSFGDNRPLGILVYATIMLGMGLGTKNSVALICIGICSLLGIREPDWRKPWCRRGVADCFFAMESGSTKTPLDGWPPSRSLYGSQSAARWSSRRKRAYDCLLGLGLFLGWSRAPWFYDKEVGAGLPAPSYKEIQHLKVLSFSCSFYEDHIEKGSAGGAVTNTWADVIDVVEWKRIPEFAILRLRKGEGEVVVRKDLITQEDWGWIKEKVREGKVQYRAESTLRRKKIMRELLG